MLQLIAAARSWHLFIRLGIATAAVVAVTALQLPVEIIVPGEPFLLNFIVVVTASIFLGPTAGFLAAAETSIVSLLFIEPVGSFRIHHAVDVLAIVAYATVAAGSTQAFNRLIDGAMAERSDASSARREQQEVQAHLTVIESMNRTLAESEARFRATFENAAVGIAHFSPDGRWLRVNEAMSRILGWPAEELAERSFHDITHPDDLGEELENIEQLCAGKIGSYVVEKRSIRKDGTIVWIRRTVSCVRTSDGSIDYLVSVVEDISERKHADGILQRQADLLDQSHDAIFTWKIGGGITYWSRGAEASYGYAVTDALERSSHDLLRTGSTIPIDEIEAEINRQGSWYGELTHTARDGRRIVVESRLVRVRYDGETNVLETNRDITARKRAEDELRESEARFRSSILRSPVPTLLYDDQEKILAVSQSWLKETGYLREELHRIEDWTARAYGGRSAEALELIRRIIAREPEAEPNELMIHTSGGRERVWSFVTSSLGLQSDGRRLFLVVARDITDRKAYEERIHLLMREANHRVKNLLGLVLVIARQTTAGDPEDFVERLTDRIQALAANQDLLGRNRQQGADLEDLVRTQLAHFVDLVGSRITTHGPKIHLNAGAAQAVGLALHELATNAGKYGALSTDAGHVDIDWRLDGKTLAMNWTEREGPPVRQPEHLGFGTTVTRSMAKRSLNGEVDLDYAPSGLAWHLTCPAANALEATTKHS